MSEIKQHVRSSKSSNDGSFQALNEIQQEHKSRPSQSNDFQSIKQIVQQKIEENQQDKVQQIKNKTNIFVQKQLRQQVQRLKQVIRSKDMKIQNIMKQLNQQKKKTVNLQEIIKIQQKQQLFMLDNQNKNFSKQTDMHLEKINELELQIQSLQLKIQVFQEQDKKIRQWMQNYLKINHFSQKMSLNLSTLVQSAIIQFETNLKQLSYEIEHIVQQYKLTGYQRIKKNKQKYNHWQELDYLDAIKKFIEQKTTNKLISDF